MIKNLVLKLVQPGGVRVFELGSLTVRKLKNVCGLETFAISVKGCNVHSENKFVVKHLKYVLTVFNVWR